MAKVSGRRIGTSIVVGAGYFSAGRRVRAAAQYDRTEPRKVEHIKGEKAPRFMAGLVHWVQVWRCGASLGRRQDSARSAHEPVKRQRMYRASSSLRPWSA